MFIYILIICSNTNNHPNCYIIFKLEFILTCFIKGHFNVLLFEGDLSIRSLATSRRSNFTKFHVHKLKSLSNSNVY